MSDEKPWEDFPDVLARPAPSTTTTDITIRPAPGAKPDVGYTEDIVKGAAGGLGRGVSGLVGLPGDVAEYGARGIDWATRKAYGLVGAEAPVREDRPPTYGSADIKKGIESVTGPMYEPKTIPGQYASTIAEFVPGAVLGGGGTAAKIANTVIPAVSSETAGQLTKGTPYEPYARVIGGVGGGLAGAKAITPTAPPTGAYKAATDVLEREGVPLSAGRRTGNKSLMWLESSAQDMPIASGAAKALEGKTATAYDRAVTERLFDRSQLSRRGVPEDINLPDPRVATHGKQSLSDEYTRIHSANALRADPQLTQDLLANVDKYQKNVLPSQRASGSKDIEGIYHDLVNNLVAGQGRMPGDVYQSMRSRMGRLGEGTSDTELAEALKGTKRALDDAMMRSMSPADAEALKLNNLRYANMKNTEQAVAKGGEHLSPLAVAQDVKSGRSGQYSTRSGDLDELAASGAQILKPLPNSGTAARTGWHNMLNIPNLISAGGGAGGGAIGGIPGAIAGAAAPGLVARAAVSRPGQAYLGNQALPQNARDVIAQTLAQQAITQPQGATRNMEERIAYEKKRKEDRRKQGLD